METYDYMEQYWMSKINNPVEDISLDEKNTDYNEDTNQYELSYHPSIKNLPYIILKVFFLTIAIFILINTTTIRIKIDGSSMEPNLHNDMYVLVNRLSYFFGLPHRGDIIVFYEENDKRNYIKRVIGLPRDIIEISEGHVHINGHIINESYISSTTIGQIDAHLLGDDEYFIMGDNRIASKDSRNFGPISKKSIKGCAWFIYWPPADCGIISAKSHTE